MDVSQLLAQLAVRVSGGSGGVVVDEKLMRELQAIQSLIGSLQLRPAAAATSAAVTAAVESPAPSVEPSGGDCLQEGGGAAAEAVAASDSVE